MKFPWLIYPLKSKESFLLSCFIHIFWWPLFPFVSKLPTYLVFVWLLPNYFSCLNKQQCFNLSLMCFYLIRYLMYLPFIYRSNHEHFVAMCRIPVQFNYLLLMKCMNSYLESHYDIWNNNYWLLNRNEIIKKNENC